MAVTLAILPPSWVPGKRSAIYTVWALGVFPQRGAGCGAEPRDAKIAIWTSSTRNLAYFLLTLARLTHTQIDTSALPSERR